MSELQATWSRIARVWWAFYWRMMLLSLAAFVIFYAISVMLLLFTGASIAQAQAVDNSRWLQLAFFLLGAVTSLAATKLVLGTRWADFRIALVPHSPAEGGLAPPLPHDSVA